MDIRELTKVKIFSSIYDTKCPLSGLEALAKAKQIYEDQGSFFVGHEDLMLARSVGFKGEEFNINAFEDVCTNTVFSVLSKKSKQGIGWNKVRELRSLANYTVAYRYMKEHSLVLRKFIHKETLNTYFSDAEFVPSTSNPEEIIAKMKVEEQVYLTDMLRMDHDFLIKRALKRYMFGRCKAFSVVRGLCREVNLPERISGHP